MADITPTPAPRFVAVEATYTSASGDVVGPVWGVRDTELERFAPFGSRVLSEHAAQTIARVNDDRWSFVDKFDLLPPPPAPRYVWESTRYDWHGEILGPHAGVLDAEKGLFYPFDVAGAAESPGAVGDVAAQPELFHGCPAVQTVDPSVTPATSEETL
ncbi:hypothetical protein HOU70_gp57 [Arthrobacter phage Liebe]|uniref:Uncharacterized protein n=2 Tax=Arthrobacter virus Liebe TaxID=2734245 RepID=A0A3G2KHU0_9CAUD|nr:hypothetical protein HOU70_gp57 [Arthrobacter phage Liebe]AYN58538.1 hypothetical protein PBI_MAUREEN_57 [Arthrobacter phage Maureen]AZF93790.1 hypothetical protein PBI_LIEBE_57 [Arthrobacter phage Liebe]